MVEIRLYEERYASLRLSTFHEIGSKTMESDIVSQPVLTSYKLLEIERPTLLWADLARIGDTPEYGEWRKPCP